MRRGLAFLFLAMLALALGAEDVEFSASIDAERIGLEDLLIYTLTFKGVRDPQPPDLSYLADFRVVQTSQSSEFRFVNGVSSSYTHFVFYLMPLRLGRLLIPAAATTVDGKEYKTQPFRVEVVKGRLNPASGAAGQPATGFDKDFFDSAFGRRPESEADVKLKAEISKARAVPGEQLTYRVLLYTTGRVEAVNLVSAPSFEGFWQEWFPVPQSISGRSETIGNTVYQVFEIRKAALFPTRSGSLTIPPLRFQMTLADSASLFLASRPVERATPEIKVEVDAPPVEAAGLPVGQFTFSASTAASSCDINNLATLQVKISGNGNLKAIVPPLLADSDAYRVFPAKISRESRTDSDVLAGTLNAEIPVSFLKIGTVRFPALEFKYLDPLSRKVIALHSSPLSVQVTGAKNRESVAVASSPAQIVAQGEDIEFILRGRIHDQAWRLHRTSGFKLLFLLPLLVTLFLLAKSALWERGLVASPLFKKKRLLAQTLGSLRQLSSYEEIAAVLDVYIQQKTGLGFAELSSDKIREFFESRGIQPQAADAFLAVKSRSEQARFSPAKVPAAELQADIQILIRAVRLIDAKLP